MVFCGFFFSIMRKAFNRNEVILILFNKIYTHFSQFSIKKTTEIYSSCLDTSTIDKRGNSPLEDLIEQYGGWRVTGNGLNSWSVEEKMGRILRDLNVQTMLSVSVMTDLMDSSKHILKVSIGM